MLRKENAFLSDVYQEEVVTLFRRHFLPRKTWVTHDCLFLISQYLHELFLQNVTNVVENEIQNVTAPKMSCGSLFHFLSICIKKLCERNSCFFCTRKKSRTSLPNQQSGGSVAPRCLARH